MPIIATAGWSIPRTVADRFPREESSLARYASVFSGVEINSTFYRRHKQSTFARWAMSVPENFRFAVKMPKELTHEHAMKDVSGPFSTFIEDIAPLNEKLGPLLCQLPPSLAFDADRISAAFEVMREKYSEAIVLEARHPSWASDSAITLLDEFSIERVLADPPLIWTVADFAGPPRYVRLHGKPKLYYSSYTHEEIAEFSRLLAAESWCVFDNTASGAAIANALTLV